MLFAPRVPKDRQIDRWMDGRTDGQRDGWMDGRMGGTDERTGGCIHTGLHALLQLTKLQRLVT